MNSLAINWTKLDISNPAVLKKKKGAFSVKYLLKIQYIDPLKHFSKDPFHLVTSEEALEASR